MIKGPALGSFALEGTSGPRPGKREPGAWIQAPRAHSGIKQFIADPKQYVR
jgi:hypothetical protein